MSLKSFYLILFILVLIPGLAVTDECSNGIGWSEPGPGSGTDGDCASEDGPSDCCGWDQEVHVHDFEDVYSGELSVTYETGWDSECESKVRVYTSTDDSGWELVGSYPALGHNRRTKNVGLVGKVRYVKIAESPKGACFMDYSSATLSEKKPECGNDIIEVGEECESDGDCGPEDVEQENQPGEIVCRECECELVMHEIEPEFKWTPPECSQNEKLNSEETECICKEGYERIDGLCQVPPEKNCVNGEDDNDNGMIDCKDDWCRNNDPVCDCIQVGGEREDGLDSAGSAWDIAIIGNEYELSNILKKLPFYASDNLEVTDIRSWFLGDVQRVVNVFETVEPFNEYMSQGKIRIWAYQLPEDHQNDISYGKKYCSNCDSFVMLHRTTSKRSSASLWSDKADVYYRFADVWPYHVLHELGHLKFGFVDEYVDNYSDTILQWFKGPFSRTRNCYGNVIVPDWFSDREGCLEYFREFSSEPDITCHQGCMGNEWWRSSEHSIMRGDYSNKPGYDISTQGFNSFHRVLIAEEMEDYS